MFTGRSIVLHYCLFLNVSNKFIFNKSDKKNAKGVLSIGYGIKCSKWEINKHS